MMKKIVNQTARAEQKEQILSKKPFAEFFAGIGLMRLGLEQEGWKIAFANDISEDKYKMYGDHFHDAASHFILGDIHKLSVDDVPTVALATASFPCNDLSLAGMRKGLAGKNLRHTGGLCAFWMRWANVVLPSSFWKTYPDF